ncbi:MAG: hypothetical protein PHC54_07650 [Candidatus Omnitrophica bacterium]|nr:hypothetical protein [Candidatus Omnitrophota bacterium]
MEKNTLEKAYETIDSVMQDMCLSEETAMQTVCLILEKENIKFNSQVIMDIISILKQWNKIPVDEIKGKIENIMKIKV